MATLASQLKPLNVVVGVQPSTDRTPLNTVHYTYCDHIRFWRNSPQKIGGWLEVTFEYNEVIVGVARTLYSAVLGASLQSTVIGTNDNLYALYGQALTNISPLETTTHAIANSIETNYATLASNPINTVLNSNTVTVTDTDAGLYQVGDTYTLSGATTTNGVPNTELNSAHYIRDLGVNSVTITISTNATSTGSGGGASVIRKTGLLRFSAATNGITDGQRVGITGATTTGGILDTDINQEFIARNTATNTFDVMTDGTATSHVTGGGGAGTEYQKQIASGDENESFGVGYGGGEYSAGLYGTSKTFASKTYPRIWFMDRYGDLMIGTAGNQTGVYQWDGNITNAPVLVANAPTAVNYSFISDNILVTFGAGGVPNQIFASDQGDITEWTASSTNQVFQDNIEGANQLVSHVPCLGVNLIFTQNQTYRFSYIGLPNVWQISLLDNSIGIIAPMARCSVNNIAYWMGRNNFYRWSGGNVEIIPSNSPDDGMQCTALSYVFDNINTSQLSKCFGWYNDAFNEVWFHYPSASSNECDRYVIVNLQDNSWSIGTMDRSCAEYPFNLYSFPRMISPEGLFYNHEQGNDDNTSPLSFTLTSNLMVNAKQQTYVSQFIPDSVQSGTISLNYLGYNYPQSQTPTFDKTYSVTATTENVPVAVQGRFYKYTWSGDELGQNWNMGQWFENVQGGAPN